MLYPLYKALKAELKKETILKTISWFNNQYTDGLVIDTSAFIEFPNDMPVSYKSKTEQELDLLVRVHYVKKLVAKADGSVTDAQIELFDTECDALVTRLNHYTPVTGTTPITLRPMKLVNIKSFQKQNGWQAYFIDFTTRLVM